MNFINCYGRGGRDQINERYGSWGTDGIRRTDPDEKEDEEPCDEDLEKNEPDKKLDVER